MRKLAPIAVVIFVAGVCVGGSRVRAAEDQARAGASRAFYEKLDFEVVGGDAAQNWLILRNGIVTVGLFQGMFERNILTFNPGWDHNAQAVELFTDVREHQRRLKSKGLTLTSEGDKNGTGPARFMLVDPDGNPVLIDQHAPVSLEPRATHESR